MPQLAVGILSGQEGRESTRRPTDIHAAAIALESMSRWCPQGIVLQALRSLLKSVFIFFSQYKFYLNLQYCIGFAILKKKKKSVFIQGWIVEGGIVEGYLKDQITPHASKLITVFLRVDLF